MDIIQVDTAFINAGDSKYRLSSQKVKGQSLILSFTHNPASDMVFWHLDGDFTYNRTGYYPERSTFELYFGIENAGMLHGVLSNVVAQTEHPGKQPVVPDWTHGDSSPAPVVIEEYTIETRAISIAHPINLTFTPRTPVGFTTYVALTHPRKATDDMDDLQFRLRFWLTERSIPQLQMLQKVFLRGYDQRNQAIHATFTFNRNQLATLLRQLEVLKDRYLETIRTKSVNELIREAPKRMVVDWE